MKDWKGALNAFAGIYKTNYEERVQIQSINCCNHKK